MCLYRCLMKIFRGHGLASKEARRRSGGSSHARSGSHEVQGYAGGGVVDLGANSCGLGTTTARFGVCIYIFNSLETVAWSYEALRKRC